MDDNKFNNTHNNETSLPDDDFVIGKGFEIENNKNDFSISNSKKSSKKKKKLKNSLKTIAWILSIVVASVGIAFGIIFAGADYMGIGFGRGDNCVIEIEQGMSTKQIAEKLKESGSVKIPLLFRVYAKLKHFDSQFKYGVYNFNTESGYEALAEMLIKDGAKAKSVKVTIPEMSTIDDIATLLENAGVCNKSDFIDAVQNGDFDYDFVKAIPYEKVYYRLEGYLFPETYDFYSYDSKECAYLAVDKMLSTLDSKLTDELIKKISAGKYTLHEIMTMASVVELEAGGSKDEMSKVAAVFYNRLNSPDYTKLQSDPTTKYPHGDGRYNTYKSEGLPPGPLNSPSLSSIIASISPEQNFDYYYFVTDASMNFYYNKTLADHNATVKKLKAEKNWIYGTLD